MSLNMKQQLSASRFVVMASARPQRRVKPHEKNNYKENPIENFFLFFNGRISKIEIGFFSTKT